MKQVKTGNNISGLLENKNNILTLFFFLIFLIISACEPDPKMVSYGSNEFGQLEFEQTSWDDEPLHEGYFNSWAGKDFSIVYRQSFDDYYGQYMDELICKGNNDLGQCDLPVELTEWINMYGFNQWTTKIDLGFNHGIISIDTTSYPEYYTNRWLISWGDNSYGQLDFPENLDTSYILQFVSGGNHNLALIADTVWLDTTDGWGYSLIDTVNMSVLAWGDNQYGQCDVPQRFQNISDDIDPSSFFIYAGGNHNIVVYDSLGINKMAAWGDNQYGQCDILDESQLNGPNYLLDLRLPGAGGSVNFIEPIYCGYNHNIAILVNPNEDISNSQNNDIDSLYIIDVENYNYYYTNLVARPVTLVAWGDNSYGQCDIPDLQGLIEAFDAGGYHNNIAFKTNHIWTPESSTFPYRDIIGWGKNDHGQNNFPIKYYINTNTAPSYGPGPGGPGDSPPEITLGGDHSIVRGPQIYRSPNIDMNFLEQFTGSLGDTVFQTITIQNIGPDTVIIDSVILYGEENTIASAPPFFHNFSDPETLWFEDDLSFDVYCIYDTSHNNSEYAYMSIYNRGWWEDTTIINLNSYFAPQVALDNNLTIFRGGFEETVYQPLLIKNEGADTVLIDSIVITQYLNGDEPPNFEPGFSFETLGEENYILPNDSIQIYFSATFHYLDQTSFSGNLRIYLRTYNSITLSMGMSARRYLGVGENLSVSDYYESNLYYCNEGPWLSSSEDYYFSLNDLINNQTVTNVHYFDLGVLDTNSNSDYYLDINSLGSHFEDNDFFISLLAIQNCDNQPEEFLNRENFIIFRENWFSQLFPPDAESVVINHNNEITYIDTFDLDNVISNIQIAIDDCGINCLSGSALTIEPNILEISMPADQISVDTISITNTVPYDLSFSMNAEAGTDIATSIYFSDLTGTGGVMSEMQIPLDTIFSPVTFSFWFKPSISNWSDGPELPYTTFIAPQANGNLSTWEIILDDSQFFPRIGWKDDETYVLSESAILPTDWYHVTFVHDLNNQTLSIYLNGILEGTFTIASDLFSDNILGINTSGYIGFQGRLSQLSIWSSALSNSEVQSIFDLGINADLMNDELGLPESTILGYWKLNENNGDIAFDYSGGERHAQLMAVDWSNELMASDFPWISVLVGGNQDIGPNETAIALLNINTTDLDPGLYNGLITLLPNYGSYDIITTVRLEVTETLNLGSNLIPGSFALHQNYPNPFNPVTTIKFDISEITNVSFKIFDLLGNEVYREFFSNMEAGFHTIKWSARNSNGEPVSAGIYFYSLDAGSKFSKTRKMILLK